MRLAFLAIAVLNVVFVAGLNVFLVVTGNYGLVRAFALLSLLVVVVNAVTIEMLFRMRR